MEQKVLRVGTAAVVFALILRLLSGVNIVNALQAVVTPEVAAWMILLQTGRVVRPSDLVFTPNPTEPTGETGPNPTEPPRPTEPSVPPAPTEPMKPQPVLPTFSPGQLEEIRINCGFSYSADLAALLTKPLAWDLTGDEPTVLIVHSHGSESFTAPGEYEESSPYHTLDTNHNMISVGAHLARLLEAGGIRVIQDTAIHDAQSYSAAYYNSRKSVAEYLAEYPSIRLVLDLHRDAIEDANGNQIAQTVFSNGTVLAPLMLVVGTDYSGYTHPQWQENLALALKLQTQLESVCPGICRDLSLRSDRFNQDLSTGALLVEVGASGNSRQQALRAVEMLAQGILSLAYGSQ